MEICEPSKVDTLRVRTLLKFAYSTESAAVDPKVLQSFNTAHYPRFHLFHYPEYVQLFERRLSYAFQRPLLHIGKRQFTQVTQLRRYDAIVDRCLAAAA
jgi:hypothetical protein